MRDSALKTRLKAYLEKLEAPEVDEATAQHARTA